MDITTTLTRCLCADCNEVVNWIDIDFTNGKTVLRPCGHPADIRFEPEEN